MRHTLKLQEHKGEVHIGLCPLCTRAEWLKTLGRDPFTELVVPATGIRLLQWTGRAIRDEDDQARVVCYDRRLLRTSFGRRMLQGLPPYVVSRRVGGVEVDHNQGS